MYPTVSLQPSQQYNSEVVKLQNYLVSLGFLSQEAMTTGAGYYGPKTIAAVKALQDKLGVNYGNYPGYWGPLTIDKVKGIDSSSTKGAEQQQDQDQTQQQTASYTPYYGDTRSSELEARTNSVLSAALSATGTGVSSSFIDTIRNNKDLIATYLTALAYGDYTLSDIFRDIKRRELVSQGQTQYENIQLISPELERNQYVATNDGRTAHNIPVFKNFTPTFSGVDPSIFSLPIFDAGFDPMFKKLVPILDPTSPEFKAEKEKIKSVYHDILLAQSNAATEQQKAIADYEFRKFNEYLQQTYNITLSNNAQEAWKQIETIGGTYAQGGIYQSGLKNEAVDDYLRSARRQDATVRDKYAKDRENAEANFFIQKASPEEIKRLIDEDIAKGLPRSEWRATKWGLVPSQENLDKLSVATLMATYPDLSEEDAKRYRESILDQYGNYRSTLYQTQTDKAQEIRDQKSAYQSEKVLAQGLEKEKAAYAPYTSQVSQLAGSNLGGSQGLSRPKSDSTSAAVDAAKSAASAISNAISTPTTPASNTSTPKLGTTEYTNELLKNASKLTGVPAVTFPTASATPTPVVATPSAPTSLPIKNKTTQQWTDFFKKYPSPTAAQLTAFYNS